MEVHHHPHLASGEKKKNFKEYFLEFLMIFLAVTMGFFAENIREHFSDRGKEEQYLKALVKDLKYDLQQYDTVIDKTKKLIPLIDSLYLNIKNINQYDNWILGKWNRPVNAVRIPYQSVLPTITQLQNSGNLRLIQNNEVASGIVAYDNIVRQQLMYYENLVNKGLSDFFSMEDKTCDYDQFSKKITDYFATLFKQSGETGSSPYDMKLLVTDKNAELALANSTINYKSLLLSYLIKTYDAKSQANSLLNLIQKEYH